MRLEKVHKSFLNQRDVTGSRALDTVYQNTTGKPLFVAIVYTATTGSGSAYTDSANPPTTLVGMSSVSQQQICFIVLAGNYYKLQQAVGGNSIVSWVEWY